MTITEAKEYIAWFKINHLPEHITFIEINSGRKIFLDDLNDEDTLLVMQEFSSKCSNVNGIA